MSFPRYGAEYTPAVRIREIEYDRSGRRARTRGRRRRLHAVFSYLAARFDYPDVLGNYIGEFLGELSFSMFCLISSWVLLRSRATANWVAILGLVTAIGGLVGMFRNVTAVVAPVAAVNNYLLPLGMIIFGAVLLRHRLPEEKAVAAA